MKRFLVLGLILTLIIGSTIGLYPVSVAAADDYQFSAGDGSPGNPYVVMTAEDLDHVRDKLGASYILGADIDLSSYSTGAGWEPIGEDLSSPFTGTFDGNDYLIRNLFIDRDITYGGLFGVAKNATLRNIRLLDVDITGSVHILGSLVGVAMSTEIIDSSASSISAPGIHNNSTHSSGIGGLVGYLIDPGAAIKNSYAAIDVSGVSLVGGLLGISDFADVVESSFASGNVTGGTLGHAGALAGEMRVPMYNGYALGSVNGNQSVGGLFGNVSARGEFNNVFQTGTITGTERTGRLFGSYYSTKNLLTNIFYNSSVNVTLPEIGFSTDSVTGYQGLSDADMKTRAAYGITLDFDAVWGINEGVSYPYLRVFKPIVRIDELASSIYKENSQLVLDGFVMDGSIGEAVEVSYTIRNSSNTPVASGSEVLVSATEDIQMYSFNETLDTARFPEGTYTAHVTAEDLEGHQAREQTATFIVDHTAPIFTEGDGTPANPYVVMTAEQLDHVRDNLGASYILGADIDLSSYSIGAGWEPIGEDASSPFTGTFDGNDYLITNLFINRSSEYTGLFGYTVDSTLQNIRLIDVDVTGSSYVGGLLGFSYSTKVVNCSVLGLVQGNDTIGGLVGYMHDVGAKIENSYSAADVTGGSYVGGLAGSIEFDVEVTGSFSSGEVMGLNYVGGLVYAAYSPIRNSYTTGDAIGTGINIGGIINFLVSSLDSSFQTGTVTGATGTTGVLMHNYDILQATVMDTFYNTTNNPSLPSVVMNDPGSGYQGLSDTAMRTRAAYGTGLDFETIWGINEGVSYPYLRVFKPIVRVNGSLQPSYKENSQLVLDGFVMDGSIGEAVEVSYTIRNSSNTSVASGSEVLASATEDIQMYSFSETLDTARFPQGTYTVHVTAEDLEGHQAREQTATFIVDAAPVVTLIGANPLQHEVGTTFNDLGATALDTVDGDVTSDITVSGSVDSNTVGSYTLTYSVTDSVGNVGTIMRTVEVVDTVAPVITLVGANPLQHEVGTTFSDPGATALDAVDGDITSEITVSGSVDSSTVGIYTLTYTVTDAAGNVAAPVMRTVEVDDTVAPVITLVGATPLQHEVGTTFSDPGATALDAGDGDITSDITVSGSVDSNTVGSYTLVYSVTDAAGNEGTQTRIVNVVDTVAPVITLIGANPLQHEAGTIYADPGATALDEIDGDLTDDITISGSVDSNTVGNYMLIYSVTDVAGNEATIARNVNVIDTVAPVITLTGANPLQHEVGTIYTDPGATALDAGDGDVSGDIIVDGSVDSSRVGSYTITYSVTDAAGNEVTMTRNVDVIDTVAPVITLTGANSLQHEVGTTFSDPGATALDAGDGDVTSDITVSGSVDSSRVGNYTLTYSVTDAAGNVATETRTVNVVDTVAPVITLIGSNPYSLTLGSLFHDPGATALDAGDGDVTSSITVSGTVDRNRVGNYSLTYEVADQAGNIATATRTIRITRAYEVASDDSRLAQLTAEVAGVAKELTPAFHSEVTEYRLETTGEQIELTLRPADVNAVITVQQQVVEDKIVLPLVEGTQTITVTVHAENGSLRNYLLHITNVVEEDNEAPATEACLFTDIQGHWAEKAICQAASLKIVEGLSQSIFAPNQSVTRAEFAVMLLRTLQVPIQKQNSDHAFNDAATIPQWAQDIIMTGVDKGVLDGYPDGTFRPQQVINRAEMAAMLAKALDWNKELVVELPFTDANSIPAWSLAYVKAVYLTGLLKGRSGNQFVADGITTRAEAAVVMLRLWQLLNQQEK